VNSLIVSFLVFGAVFGLATYSKRHLFSEGPTRRPRPGLEQRADVFAVVVLSQDKHFDGRESFFDAPGGLQAIHLRHGHIHQHNVGPQFGDPLQGFPAVAGFAHYGDPRLPLQQGADTIAQNGVIVHHQDTNISHAAYPAA